MPKERPADPRHYEPDDTTPFGFGADAPPPPSPEPEPESLDPSLGEGPKSHKKPRKADYRKVKPDPRYVDKLLVPKRKPAKKPSPELPWWLIAEALALAGVVFGAIPIVQAVQKVKTGATAAAFIGVLLLATVAIQTVTSAAVFAAMSGCLGVRYGSPRQTLAKLAALSTFAVGVSIGLLWVGGLMLAAFALAPVVAALVALLRLNGVDTLVSIIGYALASVGTGLVLFGVWVTFLR